MWVHPRKFRLGRVFAAVQISSPNTQIKYKRLTNWPSQNDMNQNIRKYCGHPGPSVWRIYGISRCVKGAQLPSPSTIFFYSRAYILNPLFKIWYIAKLNWTIYGIPFFNSPGSNATPYGNFVLPRFRSSPLAPLLLETRLLSFWHQEKESRHVPFCRVANDAFIIFDTLFRTP